MKPRSNCIHAFGFTLVELLVVIVVVVLLALALMPGRVVSTKAKLTGCLMNLRQIGIAETMWAGDHKTNFPALVSTNQGGTMEYLVTGKIATHFQALTNYGLLPRVFCCPADSRVAAEDYAAFGNANVSYFASLDAGVSNSTWVLAGDRNLMINGKAASPGFATMTSNSVLGWWGEMHSKIARWKVGTLLFPDGHAEAANEERLSALTASMGMATNRLVFP